MANEVRIGIIGAGFARTTQIPGFKNCENARVVAINSAHREHAEEVAREFDIPNVESNWRDLVARDDVDLVSIVTPVFTHCEMTLAARSRLRDRAHRLAGALERVREGLYGLCEECEGAIAPARLAALPEVTTCLPCQIRRELAAARGELEPVAAFTEDSDTDTE